MAKKVSVNKDVCIGCGLCSSTTPSVFEMDDDGLAKAAVEVVEGADESGAEEAAASCPVQAIELE
ncbi:MAG: ferredoxin [Bacilli bacterium]|nr:ferredoxin [Bacilli bacterium]